MDNELNKPEATEQVESNKESLTMTKEELDLLLQKEGDKRISQYMKTQERKQREADRLKNMSDTDKREYELQQREDAIAAKEAELARAENKAEGTAILIDKGINAKLIDLVIADDADIMYENIKLLDKYFKESVKAAVEARLASKAPRQNLPLDSAMTKEKFMKLSLREKQDLYDNNPEIYNQFKQ